VWVREPDDLAGTLEELVSGPRGRRQRAAGLALVSSGTADAEVCALLGMAEDYRVGDNVREGLGMEDVVLDDIVVEGGSVGAVPVVTIPGMRRPADDGRGRGDAGRELVLGREGSR
jgi:hypothetical protein